MGWSGGTFTRVHDWTDDEAAGYNIESSRMDAEDDNFETGINACIHKGGQNAATDNLPMGGYIHTGVGDGTARTHYASLGQVQNSGMHYAAAGGTANVLTINLSPAITAYAAGQMFFIKASASNTAAATININSVGAKNIYYLGNALTGYEITSGEIFQIVYDGTQFELLNPSNRLGCVAYQTGGQAVLVSTDTPITFNNEDADYADSPMHSTGTNPSRFNILRDGIYMCTCYAEFDGDVDDQRAMFITKNGGAVNNVEYIASIPGNGYTYTYGQINGLVYAAKGDYLEFEVANITLGETIVAARAGVHLMSF